LPGVGRRVGALGASWDPEQQVWFIDTGVRLRPFVPWLPDGHRPDTAETVARYSPHRQVSAETPPAFLVHAADDTSVPLENSQGYFAALRAVKVPAEMHVFEEGGHGFGIYLARGKPAAAWPDLFLASGDQASPRR
jgi:acetyl esterase/lipase